MSQIFDDKIFAAKPPPHQSEKSTGLRFKLNGRKFYASINSDTLEYVNGGLLLLAYHNFTVLVQTLFNCGEIQNTCSTPYEVLNIFMSYT